MLTGTGPVPSRTLWMVQQMCNHGTLIEAGKWPVPYVGPTDGGRVPGDDLRGQDTCACGRGAWLAAWLCTALLCRAGSRCSRPVAPPAPLPTSAVDRGWLRKKRSLAAPPDMRAVLRTLREVAEGMAFLHSNDVLHCDLTGEWDWMGRCKSGLLAGCITPLSLHKSV